MRGMLKRLREWMHPPDYHADKSHVDAQEWAQSFQAREAEALDGELLLDEARAQFAELGRALDSLDEKAERLLRTCATIAGLIVAACTGFKIVPGVALSLSLAAIVIAIVTLCVAQMPMSVPARPDLKYMLEKLPAQDGHKRAWIAASFWRSMAGFHAALEWKAKRVQQSVWLLAFAVAALCAASYPALIRHRAESVDRPAAADHRE